MGYKKTKKQKTTPFATGRVQSFGLVTIVTFLILNPELGRLAVYTPSWQH